MPGLTLSKFTKMTLLWQKALLESTAELPKLSQKLRYKELPLSYLGIASVKFLRDMGPVYIKAGQVLAVQQLPKAYKDQLSHLFDGNQPVSVDEIVSYANEQFEDLEFPFESISEVPLGVGSVGQVHKATLADGTHVVVKYIPLGREEEIAEDLEFLEAILDLTPFTTKWRKRALRRTLNELGKGLLNEVDLKKEAKELSRIGAKIGSHSKIYIPKVYEDISTKNFLVMEEIKGLPIHKYIKSSPNKEKAKAIAGELLKEFFRQVFKDGRFHGDPHSGNILIMEDERLAFIDWGLTAELTSEGKKAIMKAVRAILMRKPEAAADALLEFTEPDESFDREKFIASVTEIYNQHKKKKSKDLGPLVNKLFAAADANGLYVPSGSATMVKAMVTMSGVVKSLDPSISISSFATKAIVSGTGDRIIERFRSFLSFS